MISFLKKSLVLSTIACILFFALTPIAPVYAGDPYVPLVQLPGISSDGVCNGTQQGPIQNPDDCPTDLASYIPGMFKLLIGVAAALAVIMIVIGGIQYIGSESLWGKQDGREKIQKAIWGLLLAIFSWLLLYSINPDLVRFDLSIDPTEFPQAPTEEPDVPHYVRILYRLGQSPNTFVACSSQHPSIEACQENMAAAAAPYTVAPNTLVGSSCAQDCVPATPTNPTTGLIGAWFKVRTCILPGNQANTVTIIETFPYQTYGGTAGANQACLNATPANGTVTPPPSSPCTQFIYSCIETENNNP